MHTNRRIVQQRAEGEWTVRAPGFGRASTGSRTETQGVDKARGILAGDGGGGSQIPCRTGQIRLREPTRGK